MARAVSVEEQARVKSKEENQYDMGKAGAGPKRLPSLVNAVRSNGARPKLGRRGR